MDNNILQKEIIIYETKEILIKNKKRICCLVECSNCLTKHYKIQAEIYRAFRRTKKIFCSKQCLNNFYSTKQVVNCTNCNNSFYKFPNQIKKTKNNFCSKSCAATFNNKNKKFGTRRSKLEILAEKMIHESFPNLKLKPNDKITIGSELDLYFPDLKIAIQLNGPLHFLAIYGEQKLSRIKELDQEKRNICNNKNIKLYEIDCSKDKYLNKKLIKQRLSEIKQIIIDNLSPALSHK